MNTTSTRAWLRLLIGCLFAAAALLGTKPEARAQAADKFYYWVIPFVPPAAGNGQSFVIEVNSTIKSQIDAVHARGHAPQLQGHIAAGSVSYNKNYYASGHPVWNWYFTSVDRITDYSVDGPVGNIDRAVVESNPSDIAADPAGWISQHGDFYAPARYEIGPQIDPSRRDALANVSNRGFAGRGERALIAGFIITGGEPRNVVLRALGPSLAAAGVQQYATNPRIDIFDASGNRLAPNDDWKTDARANELAQNYPSLAPTNDKEAARLTTLLPGNYTVQGTNVDGTDGVILLEVYDVDYQTQ